ncbi:RNA polymerase sigma factor [Streptomyces xanthophaeus]
MVGMTHVDDVLSKAGVDFHKHLVRNGPVMNEITYFYTVCTNEALDHIAHIKKLAEEFIGDNTSPLEDPAQHVRVVGVDGLTLVEASDQVSRALKLLKSAFTPSEMTAWLLAEMYDLDSDSIAELTGSPSASAVRQTVRRARSKLRDPVLQSKLRGWTLASD